MESIKVMAEFTKVLKDKPSYAYDFICNNYYKMDNAEMAAIIKELLYGIHNICNHYQMEQLLDDVAAELDEQYEEEFKELNGTI